ncbi:MAG: metallophosphoesterase [Bryobacteraceae bacterium]
MGILGLAWRNIPGIAGLVVAVWIQLLLRRWLLESYAAKRWPAARRAIRIATALLTAWVVYGFLSNFPFAYLQLPSSTVLAWLRGSALAWSMASIVAFLLLPVYRQAPRFSGKRRVLVRAAGSALLAAPFAGMGFGIFVGRHDLRVREVDVPIPDLPRDLDGLRLVQISDIHLSPFLSERELERAVGMANELRAHLALVTGDLITGQGDPLDACLRQLARLRADAGILGCLGNHEIYARSENATASGGARLGIRFLRQQSRQLRFGNATLNISGVDYQRMGMRYLAGAGKLLAPGMTNLLLSHNPDVFDVSAQMGFNLTISGHTHGGQVNVEILHQNLNVVRFFTPYTYGLYRLGPAALWVTRGIGTVGVPARIGAAPEIALLRLCAT